jgi:protoporphyrinogen oxidase
MTYTYDFIVVGGGVAGLYAALKCVEHDATVLLLEKSVRLGGRIHTIHENGYQYEAGAGRFSTKHVHLMKLLKKYGLHKVPNEKRLEYVGTHDTTHITQELVTKQLKHVVGIIQQNPSKYINITFKAVCVNILGAHQANVLQAAFGYNAEFELMNAVDACDMFKHDFTDDIKYYSCQEGLSALVDAMENDLIRSKKCTIKKTVVVLSIDKTGESNSHMFKVLSLNDKVYTGKAIIAALPQQALLDLPIFTTEQRRMLQYVRGVS